MDLARELRELVQSYVNGDAELHAVREWLEDHVQAIHDSAFRELRDLDAQIWSVLAEYDYGHRDDQSVRLQLMQLVNEALPLPGENWFIGRSATTSSAEDADVVEPWRSRPWAGQFEITKATAGVTA